MEIPLRIYRKIGFFKSKNMQSADTSLAAAKKAQTCKPLQKKIYTERENEVICYSNSI